MKSWPRRNALALALLPVLLLGLAAPDAAYFYRQWWEVKPHHELTAAEGGTVHIGPATVRLVDLATVQPAEDEGPSPELPSGYTFWRARIAFTLGAPEGLGLCEVTMVDQLGREFSTSSILLDRTDLRADIGCSGLSTTGGADQLNFQHTYYFVLPPGASPTSVKIVPGDALLPEYVRFVLT